MIAQHNRLNRVSGLVLVAIGLAAAIKFQLVYFLHILIWQLAHYNTQLISRGSILITDYLCMCMT